MKKLGLALGAGGARGACHIGLLRALEESGITPSYIAGASMGAVIGGAYAASLDLNGIEETARRTRRSHVIDLGMFNETSRLGIIGGRKSRNIINKFTNGIDTSETKIPFCCVAVDIITGKKVVLRSGDLFQNIRASYAVPVIFEPVKIGDMILVDGGVLVRMPCDELREMGADVVIAMDALGPVNNEAPRTFTGLLHRVINIMGYELSKAGTADLLLLPDMPNLREQDISGLSAAIDAGYKSAMENMEKIKELLY